MDILTLGATTSSPLRGGEPYKERVVARHSGLRAGQSRLQLLPWQLPKGGLTRRREVPSSALKLTPLAFQVNS